MMLLTFIFCHSIFLSICFAISKHRLALRNRIRKAKLFLFSHAKSGRAAPGGTSYKLQVGVDKALVDPMPSMKA